MASSRHDASSAAARSGSEELVATVWAYDPQRGDFDALEAVRLGTDTWELRSGPGEPGFEAGDLVRVELADGELIVQERVWRQRLL